MPTNKNLLGSYDAANQFLSKKESRHWPSIRYTEIHRTIGGNFRGYGYKCEYRANAESVIAVRYHSTDVVLYYPDGRIELNSGGYTTNTTKQRINDFCYSSAAHIRVYQKNYDWYVVTKYGEHEFKDHMIIYPDGRTFEQVQQDTANQISAIFTALAEYIKQATCPNCGEYPFEKPAEDKHYICMSCGQVWDANLYN